MLRLVRGLAAECRRSSELYLQLRFRCTPPVVSISPVFSASLPPAVDLSVLAASGRDEDLPGPCECGEARCLQL